MEWLNLKNSLTWSEFSKEPPIFMLNLNFSAVKVKMICAELILELWFHIKIPLQTLILMMKDNNSCEADLDFHYAFR